MAQNVLPVTTVLMLRAVANIALHQGKDLSKLDARLACIEVFALGAGGPKSERVLGYYASRTLLAQLTNDAVTFFVERGVASASAPIFNRSSPRPRRASGRRGCRSRLSI